MYFSRKSRAARITNAAESNVSAVSGSASGPPDIASMICCMSHDTIRFSEPPASEAAAARQKHGIFPR